MKRLKALEHGGTVPRVPKSRRHATHDLHSLHVTCGLLCGLRFAALKWKSRGLLVCMFLST